MDLDHSILISKERGRSRTQEKLSKFECLRNERERKKMKKKNNLSESESSSEDEIENMRKKIFEESAIMKKSKP